MMSTAYLLVSHGSSDPRHQKALTRMAHQVEQRLQHRQAQHETVPPLIGTAVLEASGVSLAQQIEAFGWQALTQGVQQLVVVPLFLLRGVHVTEDLPAEIAIARQRLSARLHLTCTVHLGAYSGLQSFLSARFGATSADARILLAHGSRKLAGNRGIHQMATLLQAEAAFWSVPPHLETQILELMQSGCQHVVILPYFLFAGAITDAITHQTEALAEQFPRLRLRLLSPLGASTALAGVIAELALAATSPETPWGIEAAVS